LADKLKKSTFQRKTERRKDLNTRSAVFMLDENSREGRGMAVKIEEEEEEEEEW